MKFYGFYTKFYEVSRFYKYTFNTPPTNCAQKMKPETSKNKNYNKQ